MPLHIGTLNAANYQWDTNQSHRRYQVASVRIVGLQTHVLQDGEKRVPGAPLVRE